MSDKDKIFGKMWNGEYITNKKYKNILKTRFDMGVERINDITCYDNKPLMSVSRLIAPFFSINTHNIPSHIMESARNTGINIMTNLEFFFRNNVKNLDDMTFANVDDREVFKTLMKWFLDHKVRLDDVEKFIRTKTWCAYLDGMIWIEGRGVILEIKVRGNNDVRQSDIVQCRFYQHMTKLPVLLLVLNKKNQNIKTYLFSKHRYAYTYQIPKNKQIIIPEINEFLKKLGGIPLDKIDI